MDKKLPATIIHDSVHAWKSGTKHYKGLWVKCPDSLILDHLAMPHITVPVKVLEKVNVHNIQSHEIVDTLWLGKSDKKGSYLWAKVSNAPIEPEFTNA